jgi:hypothetical protein
MNKILPIITAIAGIVIAVLFMRTCQPPVPAKVVVVDTVWKTNTETVVDSILVPYLVTVQGKPVLITKTDTTFIHDTLRLTPADTARIVGDYFSVRSYRDTLRNRYGYAVLDNTITQNKLQAQRAIFSYTVPEIHTTVTQYPRLGFLSLDVGFGTGVAEGGLMFTYIDRKQNIFHIRTDYTTLGSFLFGGGVGWKLKL